MSSKNIDIPIIKNGKDICRLIFTQFSDGLYDIKIDARENPFCVQTYSLFSVRPWVIYPDNLKDYKEHDISYHHGMENKPIVIHIKSKIKQKNQPQYKNLPLRHIQAPNINNEFPLPILKLEIPSNVINGATQYRRKNRHHPVNISNSNIVEVFMMNDVRSVTNNLKKYSKISFLQRMMSIEYFCTNTIISGSQKMHTYIPYIPENRGAIIDKLNGMAIMVNFYPEPSLDKKRKSLNFTFIENEYAEDILLNTIMVYSDTNENGSSYFAGATTRDLSVLTGRNKKEQIADAFGQMKNNNGSMSHRFRYTVAQATMHMDPLTPKEKAAIAEKARSSAERLYQLSVKKEKEKLQAQRLLYNKSRKFRRTLSELQKEAHQRFHNDGDGGNPVLRWFLENSEYTEEQSYLMLSKYLELDDCRLGCCQINEKKHWWLLYDDNWNLNIFNDQLNHYLSPEEDYRYEEVAVTIGLDPTYTAPNIPADTTLIKDNCIMKPLGYRRFCESLRQQAFEQENKLLEKVYLEIIEKI